MTFHISTPHAQHITIGNSDGDDGIYQLDGPEWRAQLKRVADRADKCRPLQPRMNIMTGLARQTCADALVLGTKELMAKICDFAVSSSVNGHAQAAVVIRVETPKEVELARLAWHARHATPTL